MLSRLPISSAQLKAGNNSEKFKKETTSIFFVSFKKLTQAIYNNLINTIYKWKQSL